MRANAAVRESHTNSLQPTQVRRVCVCVDGSPVSSWTLPHGLATARAFDASLTAVHVLEPPHGEGSESFTKPLEWEMRRTNARRHLDTISREYGSPELRVETALLEGNVCDEIRRWVKSEGAGLTVLCSHGMGGWTERALASTAKDLVEQLEGPTLLIPASALEALPAKEVVYERILVPLDASPLAEAAVPFAARIAQSHQAELVLMHVVPVPELTKPAPLTQEERELERRLIERNARVGGRYLEDLRERLEKEGLRARTVLAHEDVRFELLRCIHEECPGLIVLSGQGRSGRSAIRLGTVSSFLLEHAVAPTLIARGAG